MAWGVHFLLVVLFSAAVWYSGYFPSCEREALLRGFSRWRAEREASS